MSQGVQISAKNRHRYNIGYAWRRALEVGLFDLLLGFFVSRSFTRAGVVLVTPGWPLPKVVNMGGCIEVDNCRFFPGVRIECWRGAVIKIGKGTYINRNTELVASVAISIGADCKIARDVMIMDTDQHPVGTKDLETKPVEIGDRVWLGSRVIILKGVTVGHDSIVGAGAVVTRSVPPHSVVVGSAARVIKNLQEENPEC